AETPSGHGIRLRKSVEDDCLLKHSVEPADRGRFHFVENPGIDFVTQDHEIPIAKHFRNPCDILLWNHSACRIRWRVQNHHLRLLRKTVSQHIQVEGKPTALDERYGNRLGPNELDDGFVNRKAWIWINHFIAWFQ